MNHQIKLQVYYFIFDTFNFFDYYLEMLERECFIF